MVQIEKQMKGNKSFYYLSHSLRHKKKVERVRKYIGKKIPKNIEEIKKKFLMDIYNEQWIPTLNKIKENFSKDKKKTPKSAKEKELESFVVKFTYDTQRIEGSTLTLKDTANLLEKGLTPKDKSSIDVKEAEKHKEVFYDMIRSEKDLSLQMVLGWHRKLFFETKKDISGKVRIHQVMIAGSNFVPPTPVEMEVLLRDFFRWYNRMKGKVHPVVLAALVHLKFVTIHPFSDGNGRISRLMMNFVLYHNGFPMFNISYLGRNGYYNALEKSQIKNNEMKFILWMTKKYVKEMGKIF